MDIIINDNNINTILNIDETILETTIVIDEIIFNPILNINETVLETTLIIEAMQIPAADGKSAYEIALENGFVGTEAQWLESLKGEPGTTITNTSELVNDGEDGINPFITLNDIPVVEGFVPYTGATQDVNLGEFGIQLGNLEFDTTPTNAPTGVGSMVWNDTAGTLDLKLKGGAVTLQIGQETVARVVNKTATNITLLEANYQIVRVTGAQGQRPKVDLALANNDLNSTTTLGLVTETIANNQEGFITTSGQVQQINTTGSLQGETWADGDVLYLSGTVAGQATNIKPIAPIHTVIIGFVEYAHITQGKIFVKVDNGYELEELHNVSAIAPNNNEVLTYDSATLLWKPKTVFQLPSLTNGSVLFSNGTTIAQDNTNFFWDDTNNRLGIGTNAPATPIDLRGTTIRLGNGATSNLELYSDATTAVIQAYNSSTGLLIRTLGAQDIKFNVSTSTTGLMLKGSNGNVLINTTTDNGSKLQIKAPGALSTDIALRIRNSADTADILTVGGTGILYMDPTNGNGKIQFATGTGISNTAGVGLNIGQVFAAGGGGYDIKFWDNNFTNNYAKFTSSNICFSSTTISAIEASSQFQVNSTTKGFLPPRMTTTQKNAIATPASGLVVYDTTLGKLCVRGASAWETITSV